MIKSKMVVFILLSTFLGIEGITQHSELFTTHNKTIHQFAINNSNDEFAIADTEGLIIINGEGNKISITAMEYNIPSLGDYQVDYKSVISLLYVDDYLHVATADSNLSVFYNMEFAGAIPLMFIYDDGVNDNEQYTASFDFAGNRYFGDIDVLNLEFDAYGSFPGEDFYGLDIRDISLEDIYSTVDASNCSVINLTESNTKLNINTFDFGMLPFDCIHEVESVNQIIYEGENGNERRFNLWALTDNGLALYSSENNFGDFSGWTEDVWQHFNAGNSWLRTNSLDGLQRVNISRSNTELRYFLIVHSNDPEPVVYFFDAKGEAGCTFDSSNSDLSLDAITDVYQDDDSHVYVAQGNRVVRLTLNEDLDCGNTSSNNELEIYPIRIHPNPVTNYIQVDEAFYNHTYQIFDLGGQVIQSGDFRAKIDVNRLSKGIYFLRIGEFGSLKFVKI